MNNKAERLALVNGRIVLPDAVVSGQTLVIEDGRIAGCASVTDLGSDTECLDAGGRLITPGLVDIHNHGALNHTFNQPEDAAYDAILGLAVSNGITALVASIATAPVSEMARCAAYCGERIVRGRAERDAVRSEAQLLGAHLEGPFVSPAQIGALDPHFARRPDDGCADLLLESHASIRMMTLAPELPGALALIERLVRLGIVPAAGHSMAKDDQVAHARHAGLCHVTHLWSSMSSTVREGPWRKPGVLETALASDDLTGEIIADNRHLPPTLMKLAIRSLGPDRLCAVSDASAGAGLSEGTRFGMGEMVYEVCDGVAMMLDRSSFAGSTTLLNGMLRVLTQVMGLPVAQAVRMVTLTPARIIGCGERKGSLAVGKDADVVIFDDDFSAWRTMIGGAWVYQQPTRKG